MFRLQRLLELAEISVPGHRQNVKTIFCEQWFFLKNQQTINQTNWIVQRNKKIIAFKMNEKNDLKLLTIARILCQTVIAQILNRSFKKNF